jgi:hypothetical protein
VLITVDIEAWPRGRTRWPDTGQLDVARDIFGTAPGGEFGLRYQLKRFEKYSLRASHFVEALSIGVIGTRPMREAIDVIRGHNQPVELHAHSEWLPYLPDAPSTAFAQQHFDQLPLDRQVWALERALRYFAECGVDRVDAFRAGNFTASRETLAALSTVGIAYDSSVNIKYTRIGFDHLELTHPTTIRGTCEIPVSWFIDGFGRHRPAHLAACSASELTEALLQAWRARWPVFVIVMHSFDLLNQARTAADETMLTRFEAICDFLAQNRDKFRTVAFSDLVPANVARAEKLGPPLRSSVGRTVVRSGEQILRRYANFRGGLNPRHRRIMALPTSLAILQSIWFGP